MYITYVLRSLRDGELYIGFTENLPHRFFDHQHGLAKSTACRRPFELLFYEAFINKSSALRRERYFKTNKGRTTLLQMLRESLSTQ